jgi:hypothetical protein
MSSRSFMTLSAGRNSLIDSLNEEHRLAVRLRTNRDRLASGGFVAIASCLQR